MLYSELDPVVMASTDLVMEHIDAYKCSGKIKEIKVSRYFISTTVEVRLKNGYVFFILYRKHPMSIRFGLPDLLSHDQKGLFDDVDILNAELSYSPDLEPRFVVRCTSEKVDYYFNKLCLLHPQK